jgi:dTDP-4-dehydrorhamnose reductase
LALQPILLTGGSGLLALNWAAAMRDRFDVVLGMHERQVSLEGTRSQQVDLQSVDRLVRVLEELRPRLVVHTAGFTSVEQCEARPDQARHVNAELAGNVARASARLGIKLVHVSTDHLFDGEHAMADESQPVKPRNVYASTKAEAEQRVLDADPDALVLRTNFFGWGPAYRRSFSDTVLEALRGGKRMGLFQDVFYTPILAGEVAWAAHELVDRQAAGIFNVVGDERVSKHEFGLRLARAFELDSSIIEASSIADRPALVNRPRDMSLSNRKLRDVLGRKLGGVDEHLAQLRRQERDGLAREIQSL